MSLKTRVHTVLVAALAVSVAANVSAAEPTVIGRCVAAWPPVALMLVVDVLGRVPRGSGWLSRTQTVGAGLVASVAAVASFAHMQHVARAAGESELVAVLFPLTVDGLAVVCSVALVELKRSDVAPAPVPHETPAAAVSAVPAVDIEPSLEPVLNGAGDGVVWL